MITDTHLGESEQQDLNTQKVLRTVLFAEKPDLVVFTGDIVSGNVWDGNEGWFAHQYQKIVQVMNEFKVYWASTAGNHDSEGDLTREEISELDRSYEYSLTRPNQGNISMAFNYQIPVYDGSGTNIVTRLWFIDSGASSGCFNKKGYDCVREDQIDWFRQANFQIPTTDSTKGRGILFLHIPLVEYMPMYNYENTVGTRGETVCCGAVNTGLFAAIKEQKTVEWVSCGHDHNNDYMGMYQNIWLAYGRKTGYGSYGPENMQHGVRVYEITYNPYKVDTWIRQEDGTKMSYNMPTSRPDSVEIQEICCGAGAFKLVLSYKLIFTLLLFIAFIFCF
eukprot:403347672